MNFALEEIHEIIYDNTDDKSLSEVFQNKTQSGREIEKILFLLGKCILRNEEKIEDKAHRHSQENDRLKKFMKDLQNENADLKEKISTLEQENAKLKSGAKENQEFRSMLDELTNEWIEKKGNFTNCMR